MLKRPIPLLLLAAAVGTGSVHASDVDATRASAQPGPQAAAHEAAHPNGQASAPALLDLSLEQLTDVVVTSVSRQETRLAEAPASIYVISGADIRRAGAASLPEALRLAPNLQVAQADSRNWSVTARGFNSALANKLLVLIDGRSVYSPLFSGVFWDSQDVAMDDIDRIEVISGPGATIWGANAVNGVINIITRGAIDSQGALASVSSGNRADGGALRYGAALGNGGHYRMYARYGQGEATSSAAGEGGAGVAIGGWRRRQAGWRADWTGADSDVTVSADAYQGELDNAASAASGSTPSTPATPATRLGGANLLARLTRRLDNGAQLRLQAYVDHVERIAPGNAGQRLDTVDVEAQHSVHLGARQYLTWGGGYRMLRDRIDNGELVQFMPGERTSALGNLFAQDEITLREAVRLTAGLKFEHNVYTGWEALPSLHLGWNANDQLLLWSALSRTVRAPSRIDRDLLLLSPGGATPYSIAGGPDFVSETASVFEAGVRGQGRGALAALSYSATLFYSDYERLRTLEPGNVLGPQFRNLGQGEARGLELWGRWQVRANWRLAGGLVLQDIRTRLNPGSMDASGLRGLASNDPSNHWQLRSAHDLTDYLQADLALRHVGSLPSPAVPAYTELDARLAWQARDHVELSLAAQNLLRRDHVEWGAAGVAQRIERALALKLALRF